MRIIAGRFGEVQRLADEFSRKDTVLVCLTTFDGRIRTTGPLSTFHFASIMQLLDYEWLYFSSGNAPVCTSSM